MLIVTLTNKENARDFEMAWGMMRDWEVAGSQKDMDVAVLFRTAKEILMDLSVGIESF